MKVNMEELEALFEVERILEKALVFAYATPRDGEYILVLEEALGKLRPLLWPEDYEDEEI